MIQLVEEVFSDDLLKLSKAANDLAEFCWTLFKTGGSAPLDILSHYTDTEDKVNILAKIGLVSWFTTGVGKDFSKKSIAVSLSKEMYDKLDKQIEKDSFREIIFKEFGKGMIKYCKTNLTKVVTYLILYIIKMSTPEKNVISSKICRLLSNTGLNGFKESLDILDFYMSRFLNLIELKDSEVNLTEYSINKIKANSFLWNSYQIDFKENKLSKSIEDDINEDLRTNNIQRGLRSQFPWMRL